MDADVEDDDPRVRARDMWDCARTQLRRARRDWADGHHVTMALTIAARIDVMQRACALDPLLESRRRPHQRVGDLDLDDAPAVAALLRSTAQQCAADARHHIDDGDLVRARLCVGDIEYLLRVAETLQAPAQSRPNPAE